MAMDSELTEEQRTLLQEQRRQLYQAWRQIPETQRFFQELEDSLSEVKEAWSARAFVSEDIYRMALLNATALGGIDVLNQLLDKKEFGDE